MASRTKQASKARKEAAAAAPTVMPRKAASSPAKKVASRPARNAGRPVAKPAPKPQAKVSTKPQQTATTKPFPRPTPQNGLGAHNLTGKLPPGTQVDKMIRPAPKESPKLSQSGKPQITTLGKDGGLKNAFGKTTNIFNYASKDPAKRDKYLSNFSDDVIKKEWEKLPPGIKESHPDLVKKFAPAEESKPEETPQPQPQATSQSARPTGGVARPTQKQVPNRTEVEYNKKHAADIASGKRMSFADRQKFDQMRANGKQNKAEQFKKQFQAQPKPEQPAPADPAPQPAADPAPQPQPQPQPQPNLGNDMVPAPDLPGSGGVAPNPQPQPQPNPQPQPQPQPGPVIPPPQQDMGGGLPSYIRDFLNTGNHPNFNVGGPQQNMPSWMDVQQEYGQQMQQNQAAPPMQNPTSQPQAFGPNPQGFVPQPLPTGPNQGQQMKRPMPMPMRTQPFYG